MGFVLAASDPAGAAGGGLQLAGPRVRTGEAPGIGEMGLGAEPGPSFTPQALGSPPGWDAAGVGGDGDWEAGGSAHYEAYRNSKQKKPQIITI